MSSSAILEEEVQAPAVTPAFIRYLKQAGGSDKFPFWITNEQGKLEPDILAARAFKEKLTKFLPYECVTQSYNVVTLSLPKTPA